MANLAPDIASRYEQYRELAKSENPQLPIKLMKVGRSREYLLYLCKGLLEHATRAPRNIYHCVEHSRSIPQCVRAALDVGSL